MEPRKIEGKKRREWQRIRWLDSITDSMDMNVSKLQEIEDRPMDMGSGEEGEEKTNGESRMEAYALPSVK